jgi:hypothetical protein
MIRFFKAFILNGLLFLAGIFFMIAAMFAIGVVYVWYIMATIYDFVRRPFLKESNG